MGVILRVGGLDLLDDVSSADWLLGLDILGGRVSSLVPTGFDAYARILHPAYRGREARWHAAPSVAWAEVATANHKVMHPQVQFGSLVGWVQPGGHEQAGLWDHAPDEGALPIERMATLARRLATHTRIPSQCWFGVWLGWRDHVADRVGVPTFHLPGREYVLLSGPVTSATQSLARHLWQWRPANLWWPDDHAWCVATEVDLNSTYVGGSSACIADLLDLPGLEVLHASPSDGITVSSDTVNPPPAAP